MAEITGVPISTAIRAKTLPGDLTDAGLLFADLLFSDLLSADPAVLLSADSFSPDLYSPDFKEFSLSIKITLILPPKCPVQAVP